MTHPAAHTILVVDDESLIRWSLVARLTQAGFHVLDAEDASSAVDRFGPGVELVLLDVRLPDGDGRDLIGKFKAREPACRVVLMTAHDVRDLSDQARQLGAMTVLQKPFDVEDVLRLVQAALDPAPVP